MGVARGGARAPLPVSGMVALFAGNWHFQTSVYTSYATLPVKGWGRQGRFIRYISDINDIALSIVNHITELFLYLVRP
jgi:hypothetical protein